MRAFTLIELIVVILILGILAAVAVVGYTQITGRATVTATKANLAQVAKAALAQATLAPASDAGDGRFTREQFLAVMTDAAGTVAPALSAASWELGDHDDAPSKAGQFALGFDESDHAVIDTTGSRAALVAATGTGDLYAVIATTEGGLTSPVEVPAGTTPEAVLGAIPAGGTVPVFNTGGEELPAVPALAAPADVSAIAGDATAAVTWSAAPTAVRYTVTAAPVGGGAPVTLETTETTASLTGLTNGVVYLVSVTAHAVGGAGAVSDPVAATPTAPLGKLLASDGVDSDWFGHAVAVDGDTAILSANGDDDKGSLSGSVYVFTRTGTAWVEQGKLTAADGVAGDSFGNSVALDGDTAVIGAWSADALGSNSGAAYVFTRTGTTWAQQGKLTAIGGAADDLFGYSVALDGDTAVVGGYGDGNGDSLSGAAYVFSRTGTAWAQQGKLTASGGTDDAFGTSVALDGDTAIVGAQYDADRGASAGAVYAFTRTGTVWTEQAKLTADDGGGDDLFGNAVALDGDTAVIGAYGDGDRGELAGAVYVFTRSGAAWTQQVKLAASDGAADDLFGNAVAVEGDTAVIGARTSDALGVDSGAVYVFTRTGATWAELGKLTAADGGADDLFGNAVALDGDTAVIGARLDDGKGTDSGAAWVMSVR